MKALCIGCCRLGLLDGDPNLFDIEFLQIVPGLFKVTFSLRKIGTGLFGLGNIDFRRFCKNLCILNLSPTSCGFCW